jgi:hypothetical protein
MASRPQILSYTAFSLELWEVYGGRKTAAVIAIVFMLYWSPPPPPPPPSPARLMVPSVPLCAQARSRRRSAL